MQALKTGVTVGHILSLCILPAKPQEEIVPIFFISGGSREETNVGGDTEFQDKIMLLLLSAKNMMHLLKNHHTLTK